MIRSILDIAAEIEQGSELAITYRSKNGDRDQQAVRGEVVKVDLRNGHRRIRIMRSDGVVNELQGSELHAPMSHVSHFGYVEEIEVIPPETSTQEVST